MKKTHSANIGGTVFQIEEDAYEKLQDYLQSIHSHFHFYPDVAEIVADIESRIAEQLLQRESVPQIVTLRDVERVIEAMGRIEQFDESPTTPALATRDRKLFRNPDDKIIAGVAAGLASYLGLSPLLLRIAFVVLALFFGTAIVVYLLLWALVPRATSTTDKLQMKGRALTLASIDQGVRDGMASIPPHTRSMAARSVSAAGSLIHFVVVGLARMIKWIAGISVVGIASVTVLLFTVMLVVALVNADAPPLHPGAAAFFQLFGAKQTALKVFGYLLITIPFVLVITTGLRLFWGVKRLNTRGLAGMLGVWVIALLAAASIWSGSYPEVSRYMDEYPAMAEATRNVERIRTLAATTSPLSDEQIGRLRATLVSEFKRRRAEEDASLGYYYGDPRALLAADEERLKVREDSDHRILAAATNYLDDQQLAVVQDSMDRYNARTQAALQARRERLSGLEQRHD